MNKINDTLHKDANVERKIQTRVDSLVSFIQRNEELSEQESLKKLKGTEVYKKIIDETSFYWAYSISSIFNEYLSEKNNI